ncbi:MAG: hypothetical protein QOG52_2597, partial [Frankiaceae bacterium]|nr:hypothetical protein [Frankiaceae bacterium]
MRRSRRSDEGVALLMALAFVAVFGLLVALMLQYVGVNVKTTAGIAQTFSNLEAADAAADGAADQLKEDPLVGADPYSSACFTIPSGQLTAVGTVSASCTARAGSGSFTAPAVTAQPAEAIRTTGSGGAGEGLALTTGRQTYVQGDIATRTLSGAGGLNVLSGTGDISATTCSQTGVVAPAPVCGATTPIDPGNDPNPTTAASWDYPSVATTDLTAPACGASWLVSWAPGRYSSGAGFQAALNCASKVHWFQPGVYYLDFTDATTAAKQIAIALGTTSQIVAGAPLGWNPGAAVKPTIPGPTAAGPTATACDTTIPGAVFVLGREASFTVNNGSVQMCGWWDTSNPGQHFSIIAPNANITTTQSTPTNAPGYVADVTGGAGAWVVPGTGGSLASWTGTTQTGFLLLRFPNLNLPAN